VTKLVSYVEMLDQTSREFESDQCPTLVKGLWVSSHTVVARDLVIRHVRDRCRH